MAETLVEALGEADLPSDADVSAYFATMPRPHPPRYRNRVAKDADALLPILARFASPEVKREVLRQLLGEERHYCLFCRTDWVEKCQQRGHRKWLLVDPHLPPSEAR